MRLMATQETVGPEQVFVFINRFANQQRIGAAHEKSRVVIGRLAPDDLTRFDQPRFFGGSQCNALILNWLL